MYVGNFVIQKYYGKCCGSFSNSIMGIGYGVGYFVENKPIIV